MVNYHLPAGKPPLHGAVPPNGVVNGRLGQVYVDDVLGTIYINKNGTNTGWEVV
jgi:hypothetical protein